MTTEEPKVSLTGRYGVMATCNALGIDRHTLQRKTKAGFIRCHKRRDTNRIFYTGIDIMHYWRGEK